MFDRFYRSPDSRTLPGSGLGLSIVRQVAERHGGSVNVGRSPDGGAAFELWVPGSPEPSADDPDPVHSAVTDRSQGTLSAG